ncbi:MAG TPA: hypothetical protein VG077_14515 [Verrucomicrobiae bacterium]|nr:hypothetical protein [Verrucomicrobiae bacterium]
MRKSSIDKWLVTLALAAVIAGAVWHFVKSNRVAHDQKQKQPETQSPAFGSEDFHPYYVPSVPRPTNGQPEGEVGFEKLPRAKVEAWLAKHNRDAESLLAAYRALSDTNYLNEAATNFPNDPHVELAVLTHDEFPADRRKWLDLFKASSPSNSLANYLSAQEYLQSGNTDAAVQELLAATGKSQFKNYAGESQLSVEDLAQFSGESPLAAYQIALAGFGAEDLPELATLKRLAFSMEDLQEQETTAGDSASVQNLAQMGMVLGNQLNNGESGKLIINQLVGMATEAIVLSQLDQNARYDFLGGQTPSQVLQQLKQQKASFRELDVSFQSAFPHLTEEEKVSYIERSQTHGELDAMRWVVQLHPPANP